MSDTASNLASLLFLGFLLGIRHATDADHIVAIATIVCRQRNLRGSAMIGAVWGIGHTLTILVVGGAIVLFGVVIPPRLGLAMEFGVGVMLSAFGVFWTAEGLGAPWPGDDWALLGLVAAFLIVALALVALVRRPVATVTP